jgi:hypothetical protein
MVQLLVKHINGMAGERFGVRNSEQRQWKESEITDDI